jgi:hypothetical protein
MEVHQHHLWPPLARQRKRLRHGARPTHNVEVWMPLQRQLQAFCQDLVVLDDQDADPLREAVRHAHLNGHGAALW